MLTASLIALCVLVMLVQTCRRLGLFGLPPIDGAEPPAGPPEPDLDPVPAASE